MTPNKDKESVLDPTKEIQVSEDLNLDGMDFTKQMAQIETGDYTPETPIRVRQQPNRSGLTGQALLEYRKKRNKKNKAAKKARKINRKK